MASPSPSIPTMEETYSYFSTPHDAWSLPNFHSKFPSLTPAALMSRWTQCLDRIINDNSFSRDVKEAAERLRTSSKTDRRSLPWSSRRQGKRVRSTDDGGIKGATCTGGEQNINSHNITAHTLNMTVMSADPPAKKIKKGKNKPTYSSFEAKYHALTTPRTELQEILFDAVPEKNLNRLLFDWIVDLGDSGVCKLLGDDVLTRLGAPGVEPERDPTFEGAADRFFKLAEDRGARTIADYRRVEAAFLCTLTYADTYGHGDMHFGEVYFKSSICSLLSLLEYLPRFQQLMEGWFDCNVWSWVVDQCFWGLGDVTLSRKEIRVLASPEQRTHCDGILLSSVNGNSVEFGCLEVSHGGKRESSDDNKVIRVMKCMLERLVELVGGDEGVVPSLCVVGVVCKGWTVRIGRMCMVDGVCVFRWGRMRSVPVGVEKIKEILDVLRGIIAAKNIVKECHRAVSGYLEASLEGDI